MPPTLCFGYYKGAIFPAPGPAPAGMVRAKAILERSILRALICIRVPLLRNTDGGRCARLHPEAFEP